jgi:hypothetical protein
MNAIGNCSNVTVNGVQIIGTKGSKKIQKFTISADGDT